MIKKRYIDCHNFDDRKREADNVLSKYPERLPIILERAENCSDIEPIDKNKFLVPKEITFGQFLFSIRKRLKLLPSKSFFLYTDDLLISNSENIASAYEKYKKEDGFMYINYTSENTFG